MPNTEPSLGCTGILDDNRHEHPSITPCLNNLLLPLYKYNKQFRNSILSKLFGNYVYTNASGYIHAIVEMIFYFPYKSNKYILYYF